MTVDMREAERLPRQLGVPSATLAVVANMIGTGVFTTTGFLIGELGSARLVLLAWLLGGVVAVSGALSYAELTACMARNGGEYRLLSELYHPVVGFVAGWVSLVVGFSAPIAASALAFGSYVHAVLPAIPIVAAAVSIVVLLSAGHSLRITTGVKFQNIVAFGVVLLIVASILGAACAMPQLQWPSLVHHESGALGSRFAVALIFVSFAYGGWNGAAYLAGEVRNPTRTLPLALGLGTIVVAVLYIGLNFVFVASAPLDQLAGTVEVGHVAATSLFGKGGGRVLSALIALALLSSVSAMILVGPRVYEAMGEDHPKLRFLCKRYAGGGPAFAMGLQAVLALSMILTVRFETLLMYIGYTLSISAALTVSGVFVYRIRNPGAFRPYRTWGYPMTPGLFIAFSVWSIVYAIRQRPVGVLLGLITIILGVCLYFAVTRWHAPLRRPDN